MRIICLLNAGEGRATAAAIQIISCAKFLRKNMLGKKIAASTSK